MTEDDTTMIEAPTRRDTVKYGGAVVGGASVVLVSLSLIFNCLR